MVVAVIVICAGGKVVVGVEVAVVVAAAVVVVVLHQGLATQVPGIVATKSMLTVSIATGCNREKTWCLAETGRERS